MESIKKWWNSSRNVEPDLPSTIVKIKELPMYPRGEDVRQFRFVEEEKLFTQKEFETARVAVQGVYNDFVSRYGTVRSIIETTGDTIKRTNRYLTEEDTILPKAAVITIGGMAGFLMGMRRGGAFKRTLYSVTGLGIMSAACYPHETLDIGRTLYAGANEKLTTAWKDFQESPAPSKAKKEDESPVVAKSEQPSSPVTTTVSSANPSNVRPDNDMYSSRSDK